MYDFECQCDNRKDSPLSFNEIVEFPVVVVDVHLKKVIAEFHTYVRPTLHPELTPFCTELTGIEQHWVDSGLILDEALQKLHSFLENLGLFETEFIFASCGDFDGNQINREATHKSLQLPNYLMRWINLKKVFPINLFPTD